MFLKERTESDELLKMRYLNTRMELNKDEKRHYYNLEKGYEGEVNFDRKAEILEEERYVLNDLLFKVGSAHFQIDTILISQEVIRLLDVKNFEGDFCLENNIFYAMKSDREYKNPIEQLNKSTSQFRQLLQSLKLNYLVEGFVIFINPDFTLYNAQKDQPIIFPNQVHRFLNSINHAPSKLNSNHQRLAQQLLSLHLTKNPFSLVPAYRYEQLQKGIYCKCCRSFSVHLVNNSFVCERCGGHEKMEEAILRNVKEFRLLFPERKFTTTSIYEWCNVELSKRTFCRVLKRNFTGFGKKSGTYYE